MDRSYIGTEDSLSGLLNTPLVSELYLTREVDALGNVCTLTVNSRGCIAMSWGRSPRRSGSAAAASAAGASAARASELRSGFPRRPCSPQIFQLSPGVAWRF